MSIQVSIENADCGGTAYPLFDPWDQFRSNSSSEAALVERATQSLDVLEPPMGRMTETLHKRMTNFQLEMEVPDEMKIICQPRGKPLEEVRGYKYDATAGSGSTIYIIDSGLTLQDELSQTSERSFLICLI